MNSGSPLAFFQPWMAIAAAVVLAAVIIHKHQYFRPATGASLMRRILMVSARYFLPAAIAWFFIAGMGLRILAESGFSFSGALASACTALGVFVLGGFILRDELTEARKLPPRW
jgi:hypothetical protein